MNWYSSTCSDAINTCSVISSLSIKHIGQVLPSPKGNQVIYTVKQLKKDSTKLSYEYFLYLNTLGNEKQIFKSHENISNLNWSLDGKKITFLAKGIHFQSIFEVDLQSEISHKILETDNDINSFKESSDERSFAFVADKELANKHIGQLYLARQKNGSIDINPLTAYGYDILQVSDIINNNSYDWAPDGKTIVFSYQTRNGAYSNDHYKIAVLDLHSHSIKNISYTNTHDGIQPKYSPNGKWIAFCSNLSSTKYAKQLTNCIYFNNRVCVYNPQTLKTYCLANTFNENPALLGWDKTSNAVYVLDWYKVFGLQLYKLNLNPGISAKIVSQKTGFIEPSTISLNATHEIVGFGYETANTPPGVYITPVNKFQLQKISKIHSTNNSLLPKLQKIVWRSKDRRLIEGLLITPHDFDPHKKYPLLVVLHGGPSSVCAERYTGGCNDGFEMTLPICWPHLTQQGFIILEPNYRGSTGYGKTFRFANYADLGGGDYQDIISGVNSLIKKGIADSSRLAIFGWSYGGYLTLWTISHSNVFKAAIAGGSLSDLGLFAKTSDIRWYLPAYLGTTQLKNPKFYIERSPITYIKNINTPVLMIHGLNDKRVPTDQSTTFYSTLKNENRKVKILLMPKQGHMPTNPNIILDNIQQVDKWLEHYVLP